MGQMSMGSLTWWGSIESPPRWPWGFLLHFTRERGQNVILGIKLPQQCFWMKASKKFRCQKLLGGRLWKAQVSSLRCSRHERTTLTSVWTKRGGTSGVTRQMSPAEASGPCGATDGLHQVPRHAHAQHPSLTNDKFARQYSVAVTE